MPRKGSTERPMGSAADRRLWADYLQYANGKPEEASARAFALRVEGLAEGEKYGESSQGCFAPLLSRLRALAGDFA